MTPLEKYMLNLVLNGKNGEKFIRIVVIELGEDKKGKPHSIETDITEEVKTILTKELCQ